MYRFKNIENLQFNTRKTVGVYSLIFIIVSLGIFAMFVLLDRTFVQYGDAYRQGYFWVAEVKHNLASLFSGDGYPTWSWSKGTGLEVSYLTDPFNLLAALFPWSHLELGYTLALVARMYLGGLAFIAFGREVNLPQFSCLMGGLCYSFSTWMVNIALMQPRFVIILALMPILFMSIERIYKSKSPLLFMLTVGYYIIENSYLAFMAGLVAVIYILLRYFAYTEKFRLAEYLKKVGLFMIYGLVGVLISSLVLVQRFLRVQAASMESARPGIDWIYNKSFYLEMGKHIISEGMVDGYTYVGVSILAILLLAVAFRKISIRNTSVVMALIMIGMMILPFFSSMFNGFSYNSGRWYHMIPFFMTWAAVESLDLNKLKEKGNIAAMTIGLAVIAIWTVGFGAIGLCRLDVNAWAFIGVNIAGGLALVILIAKGKNRRKTQLGIIVISCCTLVIAWNGSLYGNMGNFLHDGEMYKLLNSSTQRVSAKIQDDDFYRTDQVNWINVTREMKMPANENLWWQSKSIYLYDSKLPQTLLELNKLVGNSYGYSKRVYMLSNDNRVGLDYIYGVRYFLGDDEKHERTGQDEYAGYGFEPAGSIDGVHIFKNKYDVGLGFAYDKCISRSEFEKLTPLQREQALLQAVVIPDDKTVDLDVECIKADDIETDVKNVDYEITGSDGIEFKGNKIIASKEEASFTMKVNDAPAGQLVVSFDNLIKGTGSVSTSFKMKCENERLRETVDNEQTNQSIYNVRDYNLNMGYYDGYNGTIKVSFLQSGEYTFDDIRISSMNMDIYDKYAKARSNEPFKIESYDNKSVKGTVDLDKDGFVFFSITKSNNWDVYVDGQKTNKICQANIAFMGAQVEKGHHQIELRYEDKSAKIGAVATLVGILIAIVIALIYRRKSA